MTARRRLTFSPNKTHDASTATSTSSSTRFSSFAGYHTPEM